MRERNKGCYRGFFVRHGKTLRNCFSIFERHCPSGLQASPKTACSTAVERGGFRHYPNKLATPSVKSFYARVEISAFALP